MITSRPQRHHRIVRVIEEQALHSQLELGDRLAAEGIVVTQATLSRDLRSLGVVKGPDGYRRPGSSPLPREDNGTRERSLARALAHELLDVDCGGSIVILRTAPGHAGALANVLDESRLADVVGTIAGDDTIFVAARSATRARALIRRFESLTRGGEIDRVGAGAGSPEM